MGLAKRKKPILWCWLILVFSCLYLLPELVFNAKLVEISAFASSAKNDDTLYHIELFGRAISGIGVSLLILDLLPAVMVASISRAIASIILVFCTIWPTVFFGQKYLVDTFIVDTSTPEQRQQATMSSFFKYAVVGNYAAFKGVDLTSQGASELTFMSVLSGLVFVSDDIRDLISQKKEQIATAYVKNRSVEDSKKAIEKHNQLFKTLSGLYQTKYLPASERLEKSSTNHQQQIRDIRVEQVNAVRSGFSDYQEYHKAHIARAEARAREYSPDIVNYFTKYNKRCIKKSKKETYLSTECEASIGAQYKIAIQKAGYGYIPPDYWLLEQEGSSKYVDGDVKFYRDRFLALPAMKKEFSQKTGGYPEGITSLAEFEKHPLTQQKVLQQLRAKGLDIRNINELNDDAALEKVLARSTKTKAGEAWNQEMKKLGLMGMPPGLSWKEFEAHPAIQRKLKEEMGDSYVSGLKASWSESTFYQKIIAPKVQNEIKKLNTFISANAVSFADGGEYEELGKSAIRAAVIPPISLLLSLFLICMTMFKLPFKLLECIQSTRGQEVPSWLRKFAIAAPISLAIIGPLYMHDSVYLKEGTPSYVLVSKIEESHPIQWNGLYWLLHAQPMMQPIGKSINDTLEIYPFNDKILKKWDSKYYKQH